MRIAHLSYRCEPALGGAEAYIAQLAGALADVAPDQRFYQATPPTERAIQVPSPRLTPFKLLNFNLGLLGLRRELAGCDRIIVHNPEHDVPWLPAARTVLVSHGATWTHESGLRRWLRRRATLSAARRVGTLVANDSYVLRELGYPVEPGTRFHEEIAPGVWFVPNGIDMDLFSGAAPAGPRHPGLPAAPFVLVPRNLTRPRGVDLAVRAFASSRVLPPEARLVVAGAALRDNAGSVAFAAEVRALVGALGLTERVVFLGSVARADMPGVYAAADLTVVPTRCSEGTSLAALESMGSGVATVCTAVEGLRDLPARHCAPEAAAIAAAIDAAWPERRELGRRQRAAVERDFGLERWSASWRRAVGGGS